MGALKLRPEDILSKIDELPTLPTIVYELSQVINDPMSSTADVEELMSKDQSLTTKVLRLVNSAYYAIPGGVSNLSRAIAYLGFDTVNQLVLATTILEALDVKGKSNFNMNDFWKHSLGVGIGAETIAKFTHHPLPSDLFTCGLVHDMGKIALYTLKPDLFLTLVEHANATNSTFLEAEEALEVPKHPLIGHMLAQRWNLPMQIQTTIKYHHHLEPQSRVGLSPDQNKNVDIVYFANLLVHALKFGNSGYNKVPAAPKQLMQRLAIDPDKDFKPLLIQIKKNLNKTEDLLKVMGV